MKSLREHNEAIQRLEGTAHFAGVSCDACGAEMQYDGGVEPSFDQPYRRVRCPACKSTGFKREGLPR
jgi:DNA-directed RNA polymerase subunit RPC12/RpoP